MVEGIFVDGLIFGVMVLGILISFRIMDMADLTCDGSVATGAAICAVCITKGMPIIVAMLLAFVGGALCGLVTAEIHNRLHIPGLLASILTMTMLYSINLRVLGNKANLPLLRINTLYTYLPKWFGFLPGEYASLLGTILLVLLIKGLFDLFFRTDLGIAIGAMGSNEQMVISQGMVVQGLAGIMLGEFLFSSNRIGLITLRALLGGIIYKALMFFGRKYGYLIHITPNDFKLLTGILVIASLYVAEMRSRASQNGAKKKALERQAKKEADNA